MLIGNKNVDQIVVANRGNVVVAVISDKDIIEKEGYSVILDEGLKENVITQEKANILSDEYESLIVETDEENPVIIAKICNTTEPIIDVQCGYRVRLMPQG